MGLGGGYQFQRAKLSPRPKQKVIARQQNQQTGGALGSLSSAPAVYNGTTHNPGFCGADWINEKRVARLGWGK